MDREHILVIGGAGFIGSHVCRALSKEGFVPVTFDNLSGGHRWAVKWGPLIEGELSSKEDLDLAFEKFSPKGVIHLASSINVRESLENPALYYHNNFVGTLSLLEAMARHGTKHLVFSSSAAIYGTPLKTPITEDHPKNPLNPYGKTKWMAEQMIEDFSKALNLNALSFRYFNAAGADPEGEIGEAHYPETHLIPLVIFTAQGMREKMTLYGNDFPTDDGTAVRDFVHVSDLARAHVQGLKWLETTDGCHSLNLGTGKGHSVSEIIEEVQKQTGSAVPVEVAPSNPFESPILIADSKKAMQLLNWTPEYSSLSQIIETALNWHGNLVPA